MAAKKGDPTRPMKAGSLDGVATEAKKGDPTRPMKAGSLDGVATEAGRPGKPGPATGAATVISEEEADRYCAQLVRSADYEHYLCTLFLPQDARRAVVAVRAFNAEIARIPDTVRNSTLALARMRFWKDTLDAIYQDKPPQHPVAVALAAARRRTPLSKGWLKRIIDEREARIGDPPFHSVAQVETYADNTAGTVLQLTLQACRVPPGTAADHAATHLGRALGLTTHLRAIPYHLSRRKLMLPVQLVAKHHIVEEEVLRGEVTSALRDAVFEFATVANDHILTARSMTTTVPPRAQRAFLVATPCASYLKRLEAVNFDVLHPALQQRDWRLPFNLARTAWAGAV